MDIQRYLDNYFSSKDMPFIVGTKVVQNLKLISFATRYKGDLNEVVKGLQRVTKQL